MLVTIRPGDESENTAVQQSSSHVHQSSVQTLEPLHQIFKWTPLAWTPHFQQRTTSLFAVCSAWKQMSETVQKRSPSLTPLLKCFPALPVWHVFILCCSNTEKQQQKENNEVRRGCLAQCWGEVHKPPEVCWDMLWRSAHTHGTNARLEYSVKSKEVPKDEQSWLHDYLQRWN